MGHFPLTGGQQVAGQSCKGTRGSRVRETCPGRDLLTLWRCFGQKGRIRVGGREIPMGSCLEVYFRVGMSIFGRTPVLCFQLLQAKLFCWWYAFYCLLKVLVTTWVSWFIGAGVTVLSWHTG